MRRDQAYVHVPSPHPAAWPLMNRPRCLNCQKNAVVCEGYLPKEIWKSGKQKLEDGELRSYAVVRSRRPSSS